MAKDILTDKQGDLAVLNGDIEVGYSDEQHVEHILLAHKGDYKQSPLIGAGVSDFVRSPNTQIERRKKEKEISLQLKSDNAKNISVDFGADGTLTIEAIYE